MKNLVNKGMIKALSFGINEQIMSLLGAISGLIEKKKAHLIGLLLIFSLASSLPDVYSFTSDIKGRNKKIYEGLSIFLAEMLCVIVVGIPLVLFKNKFLMILGSYLIGMVIIIINERIILKHSVEKTVEACIVALIFTGISYVVAGFIQKAFKIDP